MVGKNLSHYKILEELGRGGMGIVYKGEDTKLHRTVAIKVLPAAALSSDDDRARFYREARAAASLSHPNIATVYEIDEAVPEGSKDDDVRPFIAMEYIDGMTLDARVKEGPLELKEALRIAGQVARALEAAHEIDIVHRDIKSANVMLTAKGEAKVLDFGLAQTATSTKLTRMGSTLGTVAYMSPEQAKGDEVDRRTDIWALGVTLYEMVAGSHPFGGDYEQAVVYSILNAEPEPLTALRTGVPMELERIAAKCMAKEAKARYQTATDLIVDLENVDVVSSRLSSVSSMAAANLSPSKPSKSWPLLMAAAGVGVVITALAFLFVLPETSAPAPPLRKLDIHLPGISYAMDPQLSRDETMLYFEGVDTSGTYGVFRMNMSNSEIELIFADVRDGYVSPDGSQLLYSSTEESDSQSWVMTLPNGRPRAVADSATHHLWIDNSTIGIRKRNPDPSYISIDIVSGEQQTMFSADLDQFPGVGVWLSDVDPREDILLYNHEYGDGSSPVLFGYDIEAGTSFQLMDGGINAHFVGSGHIAYQREEGGAVLIHKYDNGSRSLIGEPLQIFEQMDYISMSTSSNGDMLAFEPLAYDLFMKTWSHEGAETNARLLPRFSMMWNINSDGTMAIGRRSSSLTNHDSELITLELPDGQPIVIESSEGIMTNPSFSQDERRILFVEMNEQGEPATKSISVTGVGSSRDVVVGANYTQSPSGAMSAYLRDPPDSDVTEIYIRDERTQEARLVAEAAGYSGYVDGFSPDGSMLLTRQEGKRIVIFIDDFSSQEVHEDLGTWGPNREYLYGLQEGWLIRAPYTLADGFEISDEMEILFQVGNQNQNSLLAVQHDRIVTANQIPSKDYTILRWWQNYAASLEN